MSKENKTKQNEASIDKFINSLENEKKIEDSKKLLEIFKQATKLKPKMWGKSIVGFGKYHYKYESGREGDFMRTGFSPRKANFSIYIIDGFKNYEKLLEKLGKYKVSKGSCLYIKKLEDIDLKILEKLIKSSFENMNKKYPKVDND